MHRVGFLGNHGRMNEWNDIAVLTPPGDIDIATVHGGHKAVKYSFRPELMHFFSKETEKNLF